MEPFEECALLGGAMLSVQKLEFAFYGIVSFLSHLPEAKKDKRFRNLTLETFLRGNTKDLNATLGQLEAAFGEKLLISGTEFKGFIKDRNLIAHDYWRLTKSNIRDSERLANPEAFLREFLLRCERWTRIFNGLLWILMKGVATKERRLTEIEFTESQLNDIEAYYTYACSVSRMNSSI